MKLLWPAESRILLPGLAVLATAVVLWIGPRAVRFGSGLSEQVHEKKRLLRAMETDLAHSSAIEDSAARILQRFQRLGSGVLPGVSAAQAGVALASRIEVAVSRLGSRSIEIIPLDDTVRVGRLRRVSASASFESDLLGIVQVIRSLTTDSTAVAIEEIRITRSQELVSDDQLEALKAELMVRGWYALSPSGPHGKVTP